MAEWTHPRRASKETISYLTQIEPVLDQFDEADAAAYRATGAGGDRSDDEDGDDVGREQMLDNVLEEIKHQTASIMEDRKGSVVAEKIARRLTPLQLRLVLSRCRGYMLSLANNRYSSHVLQTLLSFSGQVIEAEMCSPAPGYVIDTQGDRTADGDAQHEVDLLQDIVLSLVSELSGTWSELAGDISGSHVGRAFLQVLGGLPVLSEQRGKQSRHAHSVGSAVAPPSRIGSEATRGVAPPGGKPPQNPMVDPEALNKWSTPHKYRVPAKFVATLEETTAELINLPAGELQHQVCGVFGCPLLVMLLRVHANLTVDPASGRLPCLPEESPAMLLVTKTLEWENAERAAEVVYAMSGENTASRFLEAVLWLSPLAFFKQLYTRCFKDRLLEFCEHGESNFLIQAALQRVDDAALAKEMIYAIGEHAPALLACGRAGVLWRAAQACVRLSLQAETETKLTEAIGTAAEAGHGGKRNSPPLVEGGGGEEGGGAEGSGKGGVQASSSSDPFTAARVWVPALLGARLPGEGGLERLFLNVPGARILQNVLQFDPAVAAPVLKAVATLPEAVLTAVARDNLGSRCLLDPILDARGNKGGGKSSKNKPAEGARKTILRAFRGHLVAMACDRVAWHVLLKLFRVSDMKDKRAIAEELSAGGEQARSRMMGYPSGRSVMTECMVERFSRSPNEWEDAFKNRDNRAKMLDEIFAVDSSSKNGSKAAQNGKTNGSDRSARGRKPTPSPFHTNSTLSNTSGASAAENGDGDGEAETDEQKSDAQTAGGKEKRRRQRGRGRRGKNSGSVLEGGVGGDGGRASIDGGYTEGGGEMESGPVGNDVAKEEGGVLESRVVRDTENVKPRKSKKAKGTSGGDKQDEEGIAVAAQASRLAGEAREEELAEKKKKKRKRQETEEAMSSRAREKTRGAGESDMDAIAASAATEAPAGNDLAKKKGKKRNGSGKRDSGEPGEKKEKNERPKVTEDDVLRKKDKRSKKKAAEEGVATIITTNASMKNGVKKRTGSSKKARKSGFRMF